MLTRRRLMTLAGGMATAGLLKPRRLRAAGETPERKFLFLVCDGGWDVTRVFAPLFGNSNVAMESDATTAEVGGISFVDHAARPAVRSFFESYATRTCVLNGFEVRSIAHEHCKRLLMTGQGEGDNAGDDWLSILAAQSTEDLLLPYLVMSGTAFSYQYTSTVVRMGMNGQTQGLMKGTMPYTTTTAFNITDTDVQALEDAYVRAQVAASANSAGAGRASRFVDLYGQMLDKLSSFADSAVLDAPSSVSPEVCDGVWSELTMALNVFEQGLGRCALVNYKGSCAEGWDTHTTNEMQSDHFEETFRQLNTLMQELDSRTGVSGGKLADEVTVVVCSEMGRHPQINSTGGKNHWTYTSAMLIGAGVQGGQVIGGYDDSFMGEAIDLATGESTSAGTSLLTSSLGATLLALGDVDPEQYVNDGLPITAMIQ